MEAHERNGRHHLVELTGVRSPSAAPTARPLVLDGVDFTLREGEIVALLGPVRLRQVHAAAHPGRPDRAPTRARVAYRGQPLDGPARGIAMVFQSFALFPWLTVHRMSSWGWRREASRRPSGASAPLAAIDLIGLDGFENAYPKELSGGMRQRVGHRAGVGRRPDVLLMDEPFSALDVLTAETLRGDLLDCGTRGGSRPRRS